ncbi:rho GTPase-activating protein SYDE2 isoform X1 [Xiphophorus maculatus]|uniref:Synapse defective Rho GTPase homolog 2 n=1 Tax=Xiphophorus maculatus TaxID=8083 RepID=A0A3B5QQ27_XIPMA|nr:rho GTPase-activating protein SYDE2 isoform X1 [Xiphophorus maculatus]
MADPLRRTLLAKLRGKKSKKGATLSGGYGSAAAANGGREGKEKVFPEEPRPVVLLTGLDFTAERMSAYENYVAGALVQTEGATTVPESRAAEVDGSRPREPSSGGRVHVNEWLLGAPLQRDAQFAGDTLGGEDRRLREPRSAGISLEGPHVQIKRFVPAPRQCGFGDSIGFGDSSGQALHRAQVRAQTGVVRAAVAWVADGEGAETRSRGYSRHMAGTVVAIHTNNTWNFDRPALEAYTQTCVHPNSEENVLIRSIESYEPDCVRPIGETAGCPQSPTVFPTDLQICDLKMQTLCTTEASLRYPLDSEDDDYYDNEILPFYEAVKPKTVARVEVAEIQDKGQGDDGDSAQETDRLRTQLQEAYYLLINAMNDISLDAQQISGGLAEQQATSSCSSHSRDSLCSRLSVKNTDSDSWSSGGNHSSQQLSDTESLLLCLTGSLESKTKLISKSTSSLSVTKKPTLVRSASDGVIRYQGLPSSCTQATKRESALVHHDKEALELNKHEEAEVSRAGEPEVLCNTISSDELLQNVGVEEEHGRWLNESSSSVNSLTGSTDSNSEAASHQGQEGKQEQAEVRTQVVQSVSKAYGVTVNKMQEWMHKGRLLSSEMKQRIEGSSLPLGGCQSQDWSSTQANLGGCKPGVPVRGSKSVKVKSSTVKSARQQQQPAFFENFQTPCANGREASRLTNEPSSWSPQLTTTITVSKKRNWLQQSSQPKSHCTKDELQGMLGAEEGSQLPPAPSPSPEFVRSTGGAPPRPVRPQIPQVVVGQCKMSPHPRSVDPSEENDADDEGEIWYNPIPEDDEPVTSRRPCIRLVVPPHGEAQRRPGRGADVAQGGWTAEGSSGPEAVMEGPGSGSGDLSSGNAAHSTEALHLHRQMVACKPPEEGGPSSSRPTDGLDLPNVISFSPPSSPNPTKKSSSINWSFPDKIKSPRTVRKISMKMKKLPELSRKLSVKGTQNSNTSSNGNSQLEPRAHSLRATGSGSETVTQSSGPPRLTPSGGGPASRNVISRYHLDSSVSTQHSFNKKKNNGSSKSASKGGYLSDGDSPELVAKSGKHGSAEGKSGKGKDAEGGSSRVNGTELDIDAFRHYSFTDQPKCSQYISGLMSLHFYGAEDLKPPRIDSRDVYCAIQVDSVNKARTALLTCRTSFLDMDHTFNIELENAQHLKLVVFSWEPTPKRNRVCCHGTVVLPALFRVTRTHQLAVKLEPRGLIYVKLNLMEQWQNSLDGGPDGDREPQVFGVEAWRVVERESTGLMVPLIIYKCINEIERRGCQVVGLYRLCGSAAVKKELREAFERNSQGAELCESMFPDINVITGVLKDYLRELPYPLITKQLYEAVLETMATRPLKMAAAGCENDPADSEYTVSLLEILPEVERMTLRKLLDHLKRVASYQEMNKMTCQNLAVCFGPVLLSQRQEASCHTNRVFIDSEELASALHFKKHIEVLHYLLQLWPVVDPNDQSSLRFPAASEAPAAFDLLSAPPLRRRKERPQFLNLSEAEMAGVLRPKPGRLDSPSNRYAGDWSGCGESYFPSELLLPPSKEEADYDDVPSEDTETVEEAHEKDAAEEDDQERDTSPTSDPHVEEEPQREEFVKKEENGEEEEEEKESESDSSNNTPAFEEEEEAEEEKVFNHILPARLPKEHAYQAYMKIQDMSPVLSNRVNLRDLQESIDTLIGNLERELNKNKLNVGY